MRAVIQRVGCAKVEVDGETVGEIGGGFCILLGIHQEDTTDDIDWMAPKVAQLRIFEDDDGKMNRSLLDVEGAALVVSQFTLYGDCRKGRRPSFVEAARPEKAIPLYEDFCKRLELEGVAVAKGVFGAKMQVSLTNNGPVTVVLESPERT
jgi:D-tyrosyl-tRNA(Tyr) deacylase